MQNELNKEKGGKSIYVSQKKNYGVFFGLSVEREKKDKEEERKKSCYQ